MKNSRTVLPMSKSRKSGTAFRDREVPVIPRIYCSDSIREVKGEKKKAFSYKDIKSVYTIVFFETSIKEFHEYPQNYIHKFKQQSDTGLELELLQKYVFIPLDIFRESTTIILGIRQKRGSHF